MKRAREEHPAVRVALVGCGKIAGSHMRGIAATEGEALLTAVVDPDVGQRTKAVTEAVAVGAAKKATEVAQFGELSDMPREAADVIAVCVPHDLHESVCMCALARCHCVVEKPLAPTLSACDRLLKAAREHQMLLFVAEQSAFWPEVVAAQSILKSGAIGDLVSVHAHYYESLVDTPFGGSDKNEHDPFNLGWRSSLKRCGGGIVMDGGLHWLRPLRMLAGHVVEVVASTSRPFGQLEGESLAHAVLRCVGGKEATFRATLLPESYMSKQDPDFRIIGSKGEIVISGGTGYESRIMLYNAEHKDGVVPKLPGESDGGKDDHPGSVPRGFHGAFIPLWSDIVHCVRTAQESFTSPAVEAAKDIAVVEAIYRSVQSGMWQKVGSPEASQSESPSESNVPVAVADVPLEQLRFITDSHGVGEVRHGGRGTSDLLTHLTEVRYLLKQKLDCTDLDLQAAALFHSIYGTEGFQGKTMALEDRPKLRALIGKRAEFVAYLNCVMERSTLDAEVTRLQSNSDAEPFAICSRPELGGRKIELSRQELMDLLLVHFADWAQQVASYNFWNYRRQAYAAIAGVLGGKCAQVYAQTMASEPSDSPKEVPEMVRARQLGIFDKVMTGEVAYDHLLDQTPSAA